MAQSVVDKSPQQEGARRTAVAAPQPFTQAGAAALPVRPSLAPASPGRSRAAFQSILQRAEALSSKSLAQQAAAPASHTEMTLASSIIQRKDSSLTSVARLKEQTSWFDEDAYDDVYKQLLIYFDDSRVPETNYGRRLRVLDLLRGKIRLWEHGNGKVDGPLSTALFKSKTEKRRIILKELSDSIGAEDIMVRRAGYVEAKKQHRKDRKFLKDCLKEAAKSDERMLRNTAEWFELGKAQLFAVTPTGDNEARLEKAGKNVSKDMAYFPQAEKGGPGDMQHDPEEYNKDDLSDQTGVVLYEGGATVEGWNVPGLVAITRAFGRTKEYIWETLRHEVQHDADWNKGRDSGAGVHAAGKEFDNSGANLVKTGDSYDVTGSTAQVNNGVKAYNTQQAEIALTRYKTEYRAYSYEGGPNGQYMKLDNSVKNKPKDGKNFTERQLAIFNQIYAGYEYTKTNWDADTPLTGGRTFRNEVVAYFNPDSEAFNKYNSPRVDDFYRALDAIGVKEAASKLQPLAGPRDVAPVETGKEVSDVKDAGVVKLLKAIDDLNGEDADYIFNESPAMMKKIDKHLKGAALNAVKEKLKEMADFSKLGDFSLFD